ncbi:hypothetical protein I4F81_012527 [Pyropia yezoensis]|uniref:Uncharacterized protein n=1 Tax=Pyropia yezoensis TaxID=2788 RepID=A0ACC3CJD1_PYRYE|nr:hypothetical protein I4F81_012527 [Neopyropia yezoensis]
MPVAAKRSCCLDFRVADGVAVVRTRAFSNAMAPTPPTSTISKMAHKCPFCPRGFSSAIHRQRHLNTVHSDRDLLVSGCAPSDEPPPPTADAEETPAVDSGVLEDPSGVGGGEGAEIADDNEDVSPSNMAARGLSQGTGLATMNAASAFVNESATQFLTRRTCDGVARGAIAGPRPPAGAVRHVFATSVAARIRAYYEALPEASLAEPVVRAGLGDGPSRFRGPAMQSVLRFSLGAGGCGLSRKDQASLGGLLLQLEASQTGEEGGLFTQEFPTEGAFVGGLRQEQHRVVSRLNWLEVPIEVSGKEYFFYHRDLLDVAVNAVRSAKKLDLLGGSLPPAPDGSAQRSSTLNSDLFLQEAAAIKALHGQRARPLLASLHADAAVVSWSGAAYVYPIRAEFPSVLDGGNRWVTIGYIPHIPKAVSRTAKTIQAGSDDRNDLLQRCLAVVLRRFSRASETGIPVLIPNLGTALLVARVGSVVVDYVEERSIYALMGSRSAYVCTQCRVRHGASCAPDTADADPRDVIQTLEAQLAAAERRLVDPRVSLRGPLGKAHSALAFAPALGSMHGLSTGNMNYFRVVSFDLLQVWKLGMLRTLAQRIPGLLKAVCVVEEGAVMGPVQQSLDVLNLRGFEIGRRCRVKAVAPG